MLTKCGTQISANVRLNSQLNVHLTVLLNVNLYGHLNVRLSAYQNYHKQAGAELGQAQLKLELDFTLVF